MFRISETWKYQPSSPSLLLIPHPPPFSPHGGEAIRTMIIDDIHKALDDGRVGHAAELFMALRHFLEQHPEGRAGLAVE